MHTICDVTQATLEMMGGAVLGCADDIFNTLMSGLGGWPTGNRRVGVTAERSNTGCESGQELCTGMATQRCWGEVDANGVCICKDPEVDQGSLACSCKPATQAEGF